MRLSDVNKCEAINERFFLFFADNTKILAIILTILRFLTKGLPKPKLYTSSLTNVVYSNHTLITPYLYFYPTVHHTFIQGRI